VPEAIGFALQALLILSPHSFTEGESAMGIFPYPDAFRTELSFLKLDSSSDAEPTLINLVEILSGKGAALPDQKKLKTNLMAAALSIVGRFAEMYVSLDAFIEAFEPARVILDGIVAKLSGPLKVRSFFQSTYYSAPMCLSPFCYIIEQGKAKKLLDSLSRQLKFARERRKPLRLQHHKPIPIPTYIPKFEQDYAPNKHFDPDSARAEASRLRALVRKEKKGAIRELRKDNRFLAGERAKMQAESDKQYRQKVRVAATKVTFFLVY
jgi:nucleolar protein 14